MARNLSKLLGLGSHAECDGCDEPIAEQGARRTWTRAPRDTGGTKVGRNPDKSFNLGGDRCSDSDDGNHHPRKGTRW